MEVRDPDSAARGGDRHEYFFETRDVALVKAVIAHAVRLVAQCDAVRAVFDVRRTYFYAKEEHGLVRRAPRNVPADVRALHGGEAAQGGVWYSTSSSVLGDEPRKGFPSVVLSWELCCCAASAATLVPLRERCTMKISSSRDPVKKCPRLGRYPRRVGGLEMSWIW